MNGHARYASRFLEPAFSMLPAAARCRCWRIKTGSIITSTSFIPSQAIRSCATSGSDKNRRFINKPSARSTCKMFRHPFFLESECPRRRRQIPDQHFGLALTPQDYLTIVAIPQSSPEYFRNWRNLRSAANDAGSTIKEEKDKFQVNLDVQHFAPEEISVKTADGFLVIDAQHEEREDEHGFISRSFSRRYPLPEGVDPDAVVSRLSSDGVLTITAPLKAPPKAENERIVPIIQTGLVKKQVEGQAEQGQG